MLRQSITATALIIAFMVSACATAPDPAEVCSAQWVQPRAERAMKDFAKDTKPIIKKLKSVGKSYADGKTPGPLQMLSLMNSLSSLGNAIENGQAMQDMRTLASTCDDPELIKTAMTDFMREQGVSEKLIGFLNGFDTYLKMLESGEHPNAGI